MGPLATRYLDSVIKRLELIRDGGHPGVAAAAEQIGDAIIRGRSVYAFGCSHSALPVQDIVYRAGGLMLINPLFAPGLSGVDLRPATMTSELERLSGLARIVLDGSGIEAGDILIVVSTSGRNTVPVEIASEGVARGCTVIAVTSREYSAAVESRHASGRKLEDVATLVLDNMVPTGDAAVDVESLPQSVGPVSGVLSAAILQAVVVAVVEHLLARGYEPPIFMSGNLDGGLARNAEQLAKHRDRIHYL